MQARCPQPAPPCQPKHRRIKRIPTHPALLCAPGPPPPWPACSCGCRGATSVLPLAAQRAAAPLRPAAPCPPAQTGGPAPQRRWGAGRPHPHPPRPPRLQANKQVNMELLRFRQAGRQALMALLSCRQESDDGVLVALTLNTPALRGCRREQAAARVRDGTALAVEAARQAFSGTHEGRKMETDSLAAG